MQVQLELPELPARLSWDTPLSDEDFERAAMESDWAQLERTKEGEIIVHAPANSDTGDGNSEVIYQLRAWWKTHKRGRAYDSNTGFFLNDGACFSPDAAYVMVEQLAGLSGKERAKFLRLCPAFIIELVSKTDRRKAVQSKMEDWIANGAQIAWLIDPYKKSITIYEPDKQPITTTDQIVQGTGPIEAFHFDTAEVWSCYEL